jgi:hypothetical protein
MATKKERVIKALARLKSKRYTYAFIGAYVQTKLGLPASRSHICRIAKGERLASDDLALAILAAAKELA